MPFWVEKLDFSDFDHKHRHIYYPLLQPAHAIELAVKLVPILFLRKVLTSSFILALGQALNLAKEIIVHPQQCLRVDRDSAYHATYSTKNLAQALQYEGDNALSVISHVRIIFFFGVFFGRCLHRDLYSMPS
jgi:hypothetical protein